MKRDSLMLINGMVDDMAFKSNNKKVVTMALGGTAQEDYSRLIYVASCSLSQGWVTHSNPSK